MGTIIIALCALVFVGIVGLAVWAKFHPSEDPDTAEWSNAIK